MSELISYEISEHLPFGYSIGDLDADIREAGVVSGFSSLAVINGFLIISGGSILDATALDSLVDSHPSLEYLKERKLEEINEKTREIADSGFSFDGEIFGSDIDARVDWGHIHQFKDLAPWPFNIATLDNKEYSLELSNLTPFVGAVMTHINVSLGTGRYFKNLVNAMTTREEIEAFVDPRP